MLTQILYANIMLPKSKNKGEMSMNSDQNKNENQLLDILQNNTDKANNFPFANNLNTESENINYKDLMNDNEEVTPYSIGSILSAIGMVNNVLSLTGTLGNIPNVITIFGTMLNFFTRDSGNTLINHVEALINQRIEQLVRNTALGAINGISDAQRTYLNRLSDWNNNPNQLTGQRVNDAFNTVNTLCYNALAQNASLAAVGFETILLPNYAAAATIHLLVLRDAVLYRDRWISSPRSTGDPDYDTFKYRLERYTNHCVTWYNEGLNRLPRSSRHDWVRFNNYRRDMTLSVLDLVAFFQVYDPVLYPRGTDVTLSRIIYTDYIDLFTNIPPDFNFIESMALRPHRSSSLSELDIFTAYYHGPTNARSREYWSGNVNRLDNGVSNSYGYRHNDRALSDTFLRMRNIDITSVDMTLHAPRFGVLERVRGLNRAIFIGVNTQTNQRTTLSYDRPVSEGQFNLWNHTVSLPGDPSQQPGPLNYTHKLYHMMTRHHSTFNVREALFLHAWAHKSLTHQNRFTGNNITQIPAVKTESSSGDRAILRGPGSTGGDVVRLDNSTTGLFYALTRGDSQVATTNFIIRVRYASTTSNTLVLDLNGSAVQHHPVKSTVQSGGSLTNLRHQDFGYATFSGNFILGTNPRLGIFRDFPNTELVIDKIELIPVNSNSLSEQENEDIPSL